MKKTKKIIAKDAKEWYELVRKDFNTWNREAHPEDRLSWGDWLGEMMGGPIYGYIVVDDERTDTGFAIERVTP